MDAFFAAVEEQVISTVPALAAVHSEPLILYVP
jgi:hypothetical protein